MIPSEILITAESLRFVEISKAKEVALSTAVGLIMTGMDRITQRNHMSFNLNEFECKIDPILLNLQRTLNAFRQSAITDSDDPLGEDDNQLIRSVSGSKKAVADKKLDLLSSQQDIGAAVKAEDQVVDLLLDKGLDGADMATKLKHYLSESQTLNDKLKHRIQELKAGNEAFKEQIRSDFDSRLAVSLERQNHVLLEKDALIGSLKSQHETLTSEVGRLRAQIVELGNEIDQMTRSGRPGGTDPSGVVVSVSTGMPVTRPGELPPSVLDEEAEALLKRINRYRNERTEAEKRSRELRAQLNLCEEKLAVEIDKNRLLRPMIEDLEHENREFRGKLSSLSQQRVSEGAASLPKVLRGGAKSSLERLPKPSLKPTSLYEDEEDMEDQDAYYEYYDSQGDLPEETGEDHPPNSGREVTPEKYSFDKLRLAKKKVKGFELDEIKEGAGHRLQELSHEIPHTIDRLKVILPHSPFELV